ncbi:stalk domain-containing protein [Paenibacillus sp. TAB 01]|uniref:stalk domain-containing protein n=1 Tax=Paenibacillus sp. TAB 01 TaxID=3368988 RepID=UPI0037511F8A
MNKWTMGIATAIIGSVIAASGAASAAESMQPKYDYSQMEMMQHNGAELVPLRKIAESLGYQVTWNNDDRTIRLMKGRMPQQMGSQEMMQKDMTAAGTGSKEMGQMDSKDMGQMGSKDMAEGMTGGMMDSGAQAGGVMGNDGMSGGLMGNQAAAAAVEVIISIDSDKITVNGSEKKAMYPAALLMDTTYVGKDIIDNYLLNSSGMMN